MTVNDIIEIFPEYQNREVIVEGYTTQNNISKVNMNSYHGTEFSLLFYCGELAYIENQGFGDIDLVDGQIRYSLGSTQFGKTKTSYWIIVLYEKLKHLRYDREIEGVICSLYGKDFLGKKVFTQEVNNDKSVVLTPGFLNPYYRITSDIDESNIISLSVFENKMNGLSNNDRHAIMRSLAWLSDSTKSFTSDSFLRLWIALEIGFTKSDNAVKEIRNNIAKAYDIDNGKVDYYFNLGKIYGLRCEIVHRGKNPPIDGSILDMMYYIYTDLLFFKLTGQKDKRAMNYLSKKSINLKEVLDNCFA